MMKKILLTVLCLFTGHAFGQQLSLRAQHCVNASIVLENIGTALNKSQIPQAEKFIDTSNLPPKHKMQLKGMLTLLVRQDPNTFTAQYNQQMSLKYYSDCMVK
jgi:hypothetical protein